MLSRKAGFNHTVIAQKCKHICERGEITHSFSFFQFLSQFFELILGLHPKNHLKTSLLDWCFLPFARGCICARSRCFYISGGFCILVQWACMMNTVSTWPKERDMNGESWGTGPGRSHACAGTGRGSRHGHGCGQFCWALLALIGSETKNCLK